jgi:hypothetical protein
LACLLSGSGDLPVCPTPRGISSTGGGGEDESPSVGFCFFGARLVISHVPRGGQSRPWGLAGKRRNGGALERFHLTQAVPSRRDHAGVSNRPQVSTFRTVRVYYRSGERKSEGERTAPERSCPAGCYSDRSPRRDLAKLFRSADRGGDSRRTGSPQASCQRCSRGIAAETLARYVPDLLRHTVCSFGCGSGMFAPADTGSTAGARHVRLSAKFQPGGVLQGIAR